MLLLIGERPQNALHAPQFPRQCHAQPMAVGELIRDEIGAGEEVCHF